MKEPCFLKQGFYFNHNFRRNVIQANKNFASNILKHPEKTSSFQLPYSKNRMPLKLLTPVKQIPVSCKLSSNCCIKSFCNLDHFRIKITDPL